MIKRMWQAWGKELVFAFALAIFLRSQVVEARSVPTGSMAPTVQPGDRLLAEKLIYRFTGPEPGDILVFTPPPSVVAYGGQAGDYVKRVIGLPGDTVAVRDGQVWVNGTTLDEPYLQAAPNYAMAPVVVPDGKLFMLGDNRNASLDSHVFGFVDEAEVISRVKFRIWPLSRIGFLK